MHARWRRLLPTGAASQGSAAREVRSLPALATLVAGALLILQIVATVRSEFLHAGPTDPAPLVRPAKLARTASPAPLFGVEAGAAPAEVATAEDLELTGTIATAQPTRGFAILRRRGQPEHLYASGATLEEGGTLLEVETLCALVEAGGSRRRICLPLESRGLGGAILAQLPARGGVPAGAPLPQTAEQRRVHPTNVPFSRLTEFLHPRPVVIDEHIVGYAVAAVDGSSPLPGVPRGAIIRSINGVPLSEGKVAAQMFSSMTSASAATVVVQTGAGERTVVVDIEPLVRLLAASDAAP